MTVFFRRLVYMILPALLLGLPACETPVKAQKFPELTFTHLKPIKLDLAAIEVVVRYRPPLRVPNVDHLFPTPPVKALRRWAADRLQAVGRAGSARFVIEDASAVETALKKKTGVVATFTKQQAYRYDLTVEAALEISDGRRQGRATARVTRSRTVPEDTSLNDRDRIWFELTETLMADFNAEIEKNMRTYLSLWLK